MIHSERHLNCLKEYMDTYKDDGRSDFELYNDFVLKYKISLHDFETAMMYLKIISRNRGGRR